MHNINSEYLEILIPGFRLLPPEKKNTFQEHEVWNNLIITIGRIELECTEPYYWFSSRINQERVKQELNSIKPDFEAQLQPMHQAILLERYPFLKFLQENNFQFANLSHQELIERIHDLKADYFRYRFASIPFLGPNKACLDFWNAYFEIPCENVESLDNLHQHIVHLEVSILEDWIFSRIIPLVNHLCLNDSEIFLEIKKIAQKISQNPQQEQILKPLIEFIQSKANQKLNYSPPAMSQNSMTFMEMFKNILGTLSKNLPNEVAEIADVHAIIQASGFSTQNEYSHLAILDFVNYIKYTEEIKNVKNISSAFIRPLLPLYWELVYVSKQPKNIINIIRLIMPFVLITAYLIAIETLFSTIPALIALLSLLHAPEIAMILTMVISIYVGLVMMSYAYENLKIAHQHLTNWYYGGLYQTPVYQVNERMQSMFTGDLAENIRQFYIEEMENLDMKIHELEHQEKYKGLTQPEINMLHQCQDTRKKMELEWMSVHHLTTFATDKAKEHVKARLQEQITKKHENFKKLKGEDLNQLSETIHASMSVDHASISLFQPECLKEKSEIEKLVTMRQQIV